MMGRQLFTYLIIIILSATQLYFLWSRFLHLSYVISWCQVVLKQEKRHKKQREDNSLKKLMIENNKK